jgi:hypothetical protein
LEKIKKQYNIKDYMIFPIFTKEILRHDKNNELNSSVEILVSKIGAVCGNTILSNETYDEFIISFRGNEITIGNSEKIIKYIDEFTNDMVENILSSNLPATKEQAKLDRASIKVGLVIKITNAIINEIDRIKLVQDKGEEIKDDITDFELDVNASEENITLKRELYEKDHVVLAASMISALHLIPIIKYVKDLLNK